MGKHHILPRRLSRILVVVLVGWCLWGVTSSVRADSDDRSDSSEPAPRGYLSANGLLNRGLYELAEAEYRKFLDEHEQHAKAPVARYGLGVCLYRMGRYDDAVTELSPLFQRSGFEYYSEVGTIIGQSHLQRRRHDDAAKAFKSVVRGNRDHALADDAAAGLTEALHLDGRHEEAIESADDFVDHWSDSPLRERVEFFGALSTMARDDFSDAAERFAGLLQRFNDGPFASQASLLLAQCHQHGGSLKSAIQRYREVLKESGSPYVSEALLGLATLLQRGGAPKEAGTLLDRQLKDFTDSPQRGQAQLLRGRTWFDQQRYDRAAKLFERAMETDDALADRAAYWLAKCSLRAGDFDEAAQRLEQAIARFDKSELLAEMFYDRSVALVRAGRHDDAVSALKAFRSRFPDHGLGAEALQLLAACEHQRQRYDQSGRYTDEFLEHYGSHQLAAAVTFLAAENDFLARRYEKAVGGYGRFIERFNDDPQAAKARLRAGTALYRLERFDEALTFLEEVAGGSETDEVFRPALLAIGDIHFQRREWEPAERYLADYISIGDQAPMADDALLKLGLSRQRQDKHTEALETYDRLISRYADSPHRLQAIFERAQTLVTLDRLDDATTAFQEVVDQGSDSRFAPYALNHLAAIATRRKDYSRAAELYQRVGETDAESNLEADAQFQNGQTLMAAQRFKEAETAFTRFLSRNPQHAHAAQAEAQRAVAMSRQNRHDDAVQAINDVERKWASDLDPSLRATLLYEKAWCLRELGRFDEASKAYRTLIAEGVTGDFDAHAVLELSGIEIDGKRFESAAKLLRPLHEKLHSASSDIPVDVREQTTYRLAVSEFELKRHREAAELFEEFVDAFPQSTLVGSASFYCGEALFTLGRHERAVKHLARVAEDFQGDPVYGPSLLRLGESLAALQRWARSERVFNEYLERFSDSPQWFQARFGVGWAVENQKRYDDAIRSYRMVVERHQGPTAARAQFQMGECLFAGKKYDKAARELLKVDILYAYPQWSAAALYEAGRCFERLGKTVEARAQFDLVSRQHKDTRWAELARGRLSELSSDGLPGR